MTYPSKGTLSILSIILTLIGFAFAVPAFANEGAPTGAISNGQTGPACSEFAPDDIAYQNTECVPGNCRTIPYLGVDVDSLRMEPFSDWQKILPKTYTGLNFFAGVKLIRYLGLEVGIYSAFKEKVSRQINSGSPFFGLSLPSGVTASSSARLLSYYFDMLGILPLYDCFELFGSVGVEKAKAHLDVSNQFPVLGAGFSSISARSKSLLRFGAGVQFVFCENFGIRAVYRYRNTSRIRLRGNQQFQLNSNTYGIIPKPFENAKSISLGLFYIFQ